LGSLTKLELPSVPSEINLVKVSQNRNLVAIGFIDGSIILRDYKIPDLNNNTCSREKKHKAKLTVLEFNQNSKWLVSGDEAGTVVVWNVQLGVLRFTCE